MPELSDAGISSGMKSAGLSDGDRALLDFAARWWQRAGNQDQSIRDELAMTPTRYFQRLNALLDDPEALAYSPILVRRLQRIRAQRDAGRAARQSL